MGEGVRWLQRAGCPVVSVLRRAVPVALRRPVRIVALLLVAVFVAACSGYTTAASNVTASSATLNAEGSCAGGSPNPCYWYWQYGTNGQYQFTTPLQGPCGPDCNTNGDVALSASVTDLTPNTTYQYELCGKGDSDSTFYCVGPNGGEGTYETFTTSPERITYGYDSNGRLTTATYP